MLIIPLTGSTIFLDERLPVVFGDNFIIEECVACSAEFDWFPIYKKKKVMNNGMKD